MMVVIHEDLAKYIEFMKARMFWFGSADRWDSTSLYDRTRKWYTNVKWVVYTVLFVIVGAALSGTEDFGLFDGTFVYWPICLMMSVLTSIASYYGPQQEKLTMALNHFFIQHDDPWMRSIKNKYLGSTWKYLNFLVIYNYTILSFYLAGPLIADTVLHYGFDYLERPFSMPMALTPLHGGKNATWNLKFYIITAFNWMTAFELVFMLQWYIGNFSLLSVFFLAELVIFKHQVKSLNFEAATDLEEQVENIVTRHNNIIALNKDLKSYLGLSSAFISFFTSLVLTFTVFTVYTSSNIPIVLSYGSGFVLYFCCGLLYCYIGQLIENESEEVFHALYNLPWYRYTPEARKSLNMMMRQARTPLTIDYHGRYRMNLSNFMQILRSSYSYFTLLQSMIPK